MADMPVAASGCSDGDGGWPAPWGTTVVRTARSRARGDGRSSHEGSGPEVSGCRRCRVGRRGFLLRRRSLAKAAATVEPPAKQRRMVCSVAAKSFHLKTPDGGCLVVILRMGFQTSQGKLMRTISFSTKRVTTNSWQSGLFILFLAIITAGYELKKHAMVSSARSHLEYPLLERSFKKLLVCPMMGI
ncbi:putative manganese-transporting ATPase PDR2 [Iris pallida]|uniref:Manganese-transporting ATPase PDR2 n=1 Tax=Iris pallida TaxID=29817 RepID=A0AAX6G472_IRIPA|nr:putative manganese-transporting ATPase PDR2 [Iris pallida]